MKSITKEEFLLINTKRGLATSLGVEYKVLAYNLYKLTDDEKYVVFKIKKRGQGYREIIAPDSGIKYIQENLSKILLDIYPVKNCVHGYLKEKSIKSNAKVHVRRKHLVNIDLKEFFPSINFGRVRGLFKSYPFNFDDTISTTLAQICCYKGILPQGAPTSPIISNYICRKLDNELLDLSKKAKCNYTRYADDISFSTNISPLPKEIGVILSDKLILSEELIQTIESNGFYVNQEKTRYATKKNRQEVTGLIVNEFPNVKRNYIRQVRSMLHALEKFGIQAAAKEHFEKYNYKHKKPTHLELSYTNELVGKIAYIGMIRGKDDSIYKNLYKRIKFIYPKVKLTTVINISELSEYPTIFGEGKTDWKHLKAALDYFKSKNEYVDLNVTFENYKDGLQINNIELLKICEALSKTNFHKSRILCLFDRDNNKINNKCCENGLNYKDWGNNVYSVLLPIPTHRSFNEICIEHYYTDEDIKRTDKNGRRLFLSNEFDKTTASHISENLLYTSKNYLQAEYPRILEHSVINPDNGDSKLLSKSDFADYILNKNPLYSNINFEHFRIIFDLLTEIIKQ